VKPCKNFDDVFESVKTGDVDYGVVPIENSIEGNVNRTYDLFLEYMALEAHAKTVAIKEVH